MSIGLIVPAAGSGSRLGMDRPKALVDAGGKPLLEHALARFAHVPDLGAAIVVVPPAFVADVAEALVRTPPLQSAILVIA